MRKLADVCVFSLGLDSALEGERLLRPVEAEIKLFDSPAII